VFTYETEPGEMSSALISITSRKPQGLTVGLLGVDTPKTLRYTYGVRLIRGRGLSI